MSPSPPRPKNVSSEKGPHGPLFFEGFSLLREETSLVAVAGLARKRGLRTCLVGGVVRNILLNERLPNDFDFLCEGQTGDFAAEVAKILGGAAFILNKKNGLYRVVVKEEHRVLTLDFLPLRFPRIEDDLLQRDFIINAMALPLEALFGEGFSTASLIDPLGGLRDSEKKVLRLVSERALGEDPLRCLRAVRLSERYGLSIDKDTRAQISAQAHLIEEKPVSRERIRDELCLIFEAPGTASAIAGLLELGLLGVSMPSLRPGAGSGFFLETTSVLKTLKEAELVINEIEARAFPCRALEMRSCLEAGREAPSATATLKLAAFFYDIALATGETSGVLDRHLVKTRLPAILKELLFGNKTVRALKGLLLAMERFLNMPLEICRHPAVISLFFDRLIDEAGSVTPLFLTLAMADSRRRGESPSSHRQIAIAAMTEFYFNTYISAPPPPFFTGDEIITTFNLQKGERVGLVKLMIEEALLAGLVSEREEAVAYIKKRIIERWG
ncbi:MAG: hypothetical protein ACE5EZ_06360 [Thermodesulfobacteriota bacterium]